MNNDTGVPVSSSQIKSNGLPLCIFLLIALCQEELRKEKREREQVEREKDATVADLQHKLDNMETDYEKILHVSCKHRLYK